MKTVLITGGIASGKSEMRKYLASLGYPVYDCDSRVKALYEEVPGLKARVEEAIGLPFSQLGIIFSDSAKREALEAVVYPELIKDIHAWKAGLGDAELCFIESAIAAEKPLFDSEYDEIWMVSAPAGLRMKRNPLAASRMGAQNPQAVEADVLIENSGSLEDFHSRILNLLKQYKTDY